jgi:GT2 family glycosyltransferase
LNALCTIGLPVHNAERGLRATVVGILDLAEVLSRRLQIAIVDDGSTDGTFEAAAELAREFPQVRVIHQQARHGLGEALEQVRLRLGVEHVIAHDGIATISLDELATLLIATDIDSAADAGDAATHRRSGGSADLTMAAGRRRGRAGASFRWLRIDQPLVPRRFSGRPLAASLEPSLTDAPAKSAISRGLAAAAGTPR